MVEPKILYKVRVIGANTPYTGETGVIQNIVSEQSVTFNIGVSLDAFRWDVLRWFNKDELEYC